MAKYHLTKKAVQDLLLETFAAIAKKPCLLDKEYVEIHPGLYRRSCNKHLIFYRLVENDDIEIV